MKEGPNIAHVAALIGDPARANILTALMGGKALTVSELAEEAGVTIQTVSSHLAKLHDGGLLRPRKQGRHKYFSLASEQVALVLESLMGLAAHSGAARVRTGPKDARLREARVCYNHLAGRRGIAMFESLLAQGHVSICGDALELTPSGEVWVRDLQIDLERLRRSRSPLCCECLDWSERKSHLAGSLGRALLRRFEEMRWVERDHKTRIVAFTHSGTAAFARLFPDRP